MYTDNANSSAAADNDNREARNSSGFQNAAGDSARACSSRILAITPAKNALCGAPTGSQASRSNSPPNRDLSSAARQSAHWPRCSLSSKSSAPWK
jgi:hypothetical protein